MPLDHYVSQVHLKNFYTPALGQRMYAMRKADGGRYPCDAYSQCRTQDGSTNTYLAEPRAIEEFLKKVEPVYNDAVQKLRENRLDPAAVFAIAGFAGYVHACSPTGMRLNTGPLKQALEASAAMLDQMGQFPPTPEAFGGKSVTELLRDQDIVFKVDPKYPQSIGIGNILGYTSRFGNSIWDVLHNEDPDNPFLTSDFPVAVEPAGAGRVNRIVPLTPDLAIRIRPDALSRTMDLGFPNLRISHRKATKETASLINRSIVRCAESVVYFSLDAPWIPPFIRKHSPYRLITRPASIPHPRGTLLVSSMAVVRI